MQPLHHWRICSAVLRKFIVSLGAFALLRLATLSSDSSTQMLVLLQGHLSSHFIQVRGAAMNPLFFPFPQHISAAERLTEASA